MIGGKADEGRSWESKPMNSGHGQPLTSPIAPWYRQANSSNSNGWCVCAHIYNGGTIVDCQHLCRRGKYVIFSLPLILCIELPFSFAWSERRFSRGRKVKENEILCHYLEGPRFLLSLPALDPAYRYLHSYLPNPGLTSLIWMIEFMAQIAPKSCLTPSGLFSTLEPQRASPSTILIRRAPLIALTPPQL